MAEDEGDPIKLRECIEVHIRNGELRSIVAPQGLGRWIETDTGPEGNVIGTSYMRGTGNGSHFYGFYTHEMQERDWESYRKQSPNELLLSEGAYFTTTFAHNDFILRERLEAMLESSKDKKER
jgi:hypothetical protein